MALWANGSEHRAIEIIRPVMLFGQSAADPARETGAPQPTLKVAAGRRTCCRVALVATLRDETLVLRLSVSLLAEQRGEELPMAGAPGRGAQGLPWTSAAQSPCRW
jgi:hypothetical protein